ncbi:MULTISPECIES: helix-turn-helix domain-containing protein [Halorussus]|uniref:helix-turn-helix domain-containing protein n=1 Tax=Halorussus TaxID=1070314 RepID=UPI000E20CD8E|nr:MULTISPECIES: helix-turn-helix domain-containing protein [Halorussus]NHN61072.1 DNA-binding protein [Halorussus sp. JP-T4]
MGLVAEFEIDCEALPLTGVAAAVPDATLILELQFNHGNRPVFLVTVTGGSRTAVESAFTEAYDIGECTLVGQAGETRRYQALPALSFEEQLGDHLDDLAELEALATADAIIERIEVIPDGWRQTGWFADRQAFGRFSSFWQNNAGFRLCRLTRDGESEPPGDGLTDHQQEALRTAYELGYFDIPRRATLEDVADELDISSSSVSERLRRAQTQLIQETVAPTWPPLPD